MLDACLDRIARYDPSLNALTTFNTERARVEASASTQRWAAGRPCGPLDGVPIGVKDMQDVAGLPTTNGNPLMRGNVAEQDALIVARLRRAGAIVVAKTNVPEFGAGGNSVNPVWGATGNPYDPTRIAGGSSGGSAAALAASFLPLCTGSDTGGSLRLPAALCGVVGYRPSGDVVAHPGRPLGWSVISVLGPMARNMDDLLLMLRAIQGADAGDPLTVPTDPARFDDITPADIGGLRVGYSVDFGDLPVDPDVRVAFQARVKAIAPHVATCEPVDMNLGQMDRCFDILRAESFVAAFDATGEGSVDQFGAHVAANVALGRGLSFRDRAWAHLEQTRILRRFRERTDDFDIILLPTVPVPAFPWRQSYPARIEGQEMDIYYRWLALTYRGSLMGGPAITLPSGAGADGLPFGVQLLGRLQGDRALLSAALSLEALFASMPATRPLTPDLKLTLSAQVDLKSPVTHPPHETGTGQTIQVGSAV
ncbi:amidase [Sedimentitalea sp. XS_ASV28]|uniref:amidase n=1 Tax=Sedimentitalea sp. XS_ASV28 TaxID=3241296 RepID=UPI003511ABE5